MHACRDARARGREAGCRDSATGGVACRRGFRRSSGLWGSPLRRCGSGCTNIATSGHLRITYVHVTTSYPTLHPTTSGALAGSAARSASVTVRSGRCGTDVLCDRHLDAEASVPEEVASPCTHRIGNQSGRSGVAALVRGPARFSLLRPATPSTAPPGSRSPPRRAGHLVQQPGCIARWRRHGLHEGLDQHRSTRGPDPVTV